MVNGKNPNTKLQGKPCFPWVGGKRRLVPILSQNLPENFSQFKTYIEPFVGGGAMLFWIRENYPQIRCVICDSNKDLINVFRMVRDSPEKLIQALNAIRNEYEPLDLTSRKQMFMKKREEFNFGGPEPVNSAAIFIFLMTTCFNGIYSINKKGEITVTFGNGKKTNFADAEQLRYNSMLLQGVEIYEGDYQQTDKYASAGSFFYFDPPYKPVNESASYTAYMPDKFNDPEQVRLTDFCKRINTAGALWMLSNSDPKEANPKNTFFDDLYGQFNIQRVSIFRSICSIASKRKNVNELIITNY